MAIEETVLNEHLQHLETVRQWSPRLVARLETTIRTAEDAALFRINPFQYAAEKGLNDIETLDLFLHATRRGLFEMEWHLVCAVCGHVVESLRQLSDVHSHYYCPMCNLHNVGYLDDYIQVSFTISPKVRPISFHQPRQLDLEDYFFRYCFSKGVLPLYGMRYAEVLKMITQHLSFLEPHEKMLVEKDIASGLFQVKDIYQFNTLSFMVGDTPTPEVTAITCAVADQELKAVNYPMLPTMDFQREYLNFTVKPVAQVQPGKYCFEIENQLDQRTPLWMVFYPAEFVSAPVKLLEFEPFLSGKRLLMSQTFRDLFRTEVINSNEEIGIRSITFLFTDLKGSTALYDQVGDAKAFYLVRQHFEALNQVIAQNAGAVVKTIGDAVMSTFANPQDAVRAALAMLRELEALNQTISEKLILKIGIHQGHSIAVTLNDRLDYFGQTVNIAARVQGLADAGEIYITEDVYHDISSEFKDVEFIPEQVIVKGVGGKLQVYKITLK